MSVKLMAKAWEMDIPQGQKMVLLALCDHANDDGNCYPSQEKLASKCSTTERSIGRHVEWLETHGILTTSRRQKNGRRLSDFYQIDLDNYTKSEPDNLSPDNLSPDKKDKANPTISTELPDNLSPSYNKEEPSVNHQVNHQCGDVPKKATRLPEDWQLGKDNYDFAISRGLDHQIIQDEFLKFTNYWTAKSGKDATKLDWNKTWQNWVMNCRQTKLSSKPAPFDPVAENNKNRTSKQGGRHDYIDGEYTRLV